jgi:hypothetical protein
VPASLHDAEEAAQTIFIILKDGGAIEMKKFMLKTNKP